MPRLAPVNVLLEHIRRVLEDLDRQHAEATARIRRATWPLEVVELDLRNAKLRIPLEEVTRTVEDLERQHI